VAQTPTQPPQAQSIRADSVLIAEVNASNDAELRLARLAQSKASADVVKRFAQKMETDHNSMQKEWADVSARGGTRVTGALTPRLQGQISQLERLSGPGFDRAYMTAMVENHRELLNTFQTSRRTAQSSEVRQLVARGLPSVQEHLTLSQQIAAQVGSDTTVATIAGNDDRSNDDRGNKDRKKSGNINKDRKYIQNIDAHHNLEIGLGRLAETRGGNEAVKDFGRRMVRDHTRLREQWLTMISDNGLKFKSGMGPRHREKIDWLETLSGREFDREYMTLMTQHHRGYLSYFRKEGRAANSAGVRERVNNAIPILEQHFREAKQIAGRVGADTITVKVRPIPRPSASRR
jgi:putative membrane protein